MKKMFALQPFTKVALDLSLTGEISRLANQLNIKYQLVGDLSQIKIPSWTNHPQRQFQLWEATCFEFFIGPLGESYYWEFNLSPSGDWNVFRLNDYRQGLQNEENIVDLPIMVKQTANLLAIELQFDLDLLVTADRVLEISVTTVIQDRNHNFSYWALQHSGTEADFHRRNDFILKMSPI